MKKLLEAILIFWLLVTGSAGHAQSPCDNFLKLLKKQPHHLEFVKCEKINEAQTEKLIATYRVLGAHAPEIEKFFMRTANMPELRFVCCAWEPWPSHLKLSRRGYFRNRFSYDYEVTMFTEETLIETRSKWREIFYFFVTVALPLEAPPF
ncbi:MAG: DUF4952 domain-containing protein [Herminiimonas sp.]|nr:DUF4952 domain-containing protein [Herminiimonas sp.]